MQSKVRIQALKYLSTIYGVTYLGHVPSLITLYKVRSKITLFGVLRTVDPRRHLRTVVVCAVVEPAALDGRGSAATTEVGQPIVVFRGHKQAMVLLHGLVGLYKMPVREKDIMYCYLFEMHLLLFK